MGPDETQPGSTPDRLLCLVFLTRGPVRDILIVLEA
jgi:hypothetical protein